MSSTGKDDGRAPLMGALLRLAAQGMQQRLSSWIGESGYEGIQPAHSAVIQPLWQRPEGLRLTELARLSQITKQSMSALVAELEASGYIARTADREDARAMRIHLTARGRHYVADVRALARAVEQEWAARSLGAGAVQTFRRITLPAIKWAVVYGVVLALARSLGEFGAVKVVSGNIVGQSQTATLSVEQEYQNFNQHAAFSVAAVLALAAMLCLVVVAILRPKEEQA